MFSQIIQRQHKTDRMPSWHFSYEMFVIPMKPPRYRICQTSHTHCMFDAQSVGTWELYFNDRLVSALLRLFGIELKPCRLVRFLVGDSGSSGTLDCSILPGK